MLLCHFSGVRVGLGGQKISKSESFFFFFSPGGPLGLIQNTRQFIFRQVLGYIQCISRTPLFLRCFGTRIQVSNPDSSGGLRIQEPTGAAAIPMTLGKSEIYT